MPALPDLTRPAADDSDPLEPEADAATAPSSGEVLANSAGVDVAALRLITCIRDEGSFTAAAAALGQTQPAVSQAVRRLEERLGTVLVRRHGRSVALTEAGEVLAECAGPVLGSLAAAGARVRAIGGLEAGRIRVMAFPSSSVALLPQALADIRRRHPGVSVQFLEAEPPESIAAVRSGACDLAIAFSYQGTDAGRGEDLTGLVVEDLVEDPVLVALPVDHPLAQGEGPVPLAELARESWIAGCPRCRGHLESLADQVGFRPEIAYETEDYVAVIGLVAAGLGVALIPDLVRRGLSRVVGANPAGDSIVLRPIDPASSRTVHLVTTNDLARIPSVAATVTALRQVVADGV